MKEPHREHASDIRDGDVITVGPATISVVSVYSRGGEQLARCVVGTDTRSPVTVTCASLARYVETNGKSELSVVVRTKSAA